MRLHVVILAGLIVWNLLPAVARSVPSPATQPATTQSSDPAARAYSQALERLSSADAVLAWEAMPLDPTGTQLGKSKTTAAIAALLARHEKTLELLRRGAREPRCDWSQLRAPAISHALVNAANEDETTQPATMQTATTRATSTTTTSRAATADPNEPDANDPEYNTMMAAGTLPMLAALRAQQLFEQQQPGEAAMWLADALAITRQITSTTDFGLFNIGVMFERAVIGAIAEHLLDVPRPELEQLKTRLASLPPPGRLRNLMGPRAEATAQAAEGLRAEMAATDAELAAADPSTTTPTTTTTQGSKFLQGMAVGSRAVVEAMSVPPDVAREKLEAALKPLDEDDKAYWRSSARTALTLRVIEAPLEAQRPMLLAAIDIALHGPDAVKKTKDRFAASGGQGGDAPFDYRPMGKGFQLMSKLTVNRKPVSLEVGDVTASPR